METAAQCPSCGEPIEDPSTEYCPRCGEAVGADGDTA